MIAFFAALAHVLSRPRAAPSPPWKMIPILGGAIGLMLGAKASAGPLVGTGLAAAGIGTLLARPRGSSRFGSALALFLSIALLFGVSVGGYWYLRNWMRTGSPLYPVGVVAAGHTLFPGLSISEAIHERENTPDTMRTWSAGRRIFFNWAQGGRQWPRSILGADSRQGGLGYLWLLGCLPSMGLLAYRCLRHRDFRDRFRPVLIVGMAAGIAFLVVPMNWWARYTVWIYGLGLPCFAWARSEIGRSAGPGLMRRIWLGACFSLLVFEGVWSEGFILGRAYPGPRPLHPADVLRPVNWRWEANYVFPETRGTEFDEILASRDAVAMGPACREEGCRFESRIFGQLSYPIGGREIVPLTDPPEPDAAAEIKAKSVRFIIWDAERPPDLAGDIPVLEIRRVADFWIIVLR